MVMTGKEAQKRLVKQYKRQNEHIKENYDRVSVTLPKGTTDRIKATGNSVNGYIKDVVLADLEEQEESKSVLVDIPKATKRYNNLMMFLAKEHCTIGTSYSESTEGWSLRDMVAECDYTLSTYYEAGHANAEMKEEDPETWKSETGKLKRFIETYKPFIDGFKCTAGHCSKYDK